VCSSDLNKTSELFKQLGFVEVRRTDHHGGAVELENPEQPGLILEFTTIRQDRNQVPGFDHAGFNLGEDQLKELLAAGFPEGDAPKLVPDSGRITSNWKDYDGIKWQFTLN
jgi:glyoxylase I family protein